MFVQGAQLMLGAGKTLVNQLESVPTLMELLV